VRGAFSGAVGDKTGLFVEADGGTLLLDEIAELPLELQVKLLRVLQDGQVRRVGANHAVAVDVRVIAATHRPLRQLVERGAFREDLYYRLRVFQVTLPPLRDRSEDILPLAREILRGLAGAAKVLDPEAERALLAHRWPGNVRELVNAIRHGAALAQTAVVEREDLPEDVTAPERQPAETRTPPPGVVRAVAEVERELVGAATAGGGPLRTLAQVEREYILAVVRACHGNQSEAARVLGIGRNTLWRKLEAYRDEDDAAAATRDDQRAG
jgi:two-component system response regulator HydG